MILIITRDGDRHSDYVIEKLKGFGETSLKLDYSGFPLNCSITSKLGDVFFEIDGKTVAGSEVKSVLYRRRADPEAHPEIADERIRDYIREECQNLIDSLPQTLKSLWVSHPDNVRSASRKAYQLRLAHDLGFQIPLYMISNSPTDVERFLEDENIRFAVVKALYNTGIRFEENGHKRLVSFLTRKLERQVVLDHIQRLKNCPVIIQGYVEKRVELRVTIVGKKIFACAIHSQKSNISNEDWRRYDLANTPYIPYTLPDDIAEKCLSLVDRLGLMFGCIDIIVTPDDEYVFLEINPTGQWLWVEELTGLPITESVCRLLAGTGP